MSSQRARDQTMPDTVADMADLELNRPLARPSSTPTSTRWSSASIIEDVTGQTWTELRRTSTSSNRSQWTPPSPTRTCAEAAGLTATTGRSSVSRSKPTPSISTGRRNRLRLLHRQRHGPLPHHVPQRGLLDGNSCSALPESTRCSPQPPTSEPSACRASRSPPATEPDGSSAIRPRRRCPVASGLAPAFHRMDGAAPRHRPSRRRPPQRGKPVRDRRRQRRLEPNPPGHRQHPPRRRPPSGTGSARFFIVFTPSSQRSASQAITLDRHRPKRASPRHRCGGLATPLTGKSGSGDSSSDVSGITGGLGWVDRIHVRSRPHPRRRRRSAGLAVITGAVRIALLIQRRPTTGSAPTHADLTNEADGLRSIDTTVPSGPSIKQPSGGAR